MTKALRQLADIGVAVWLDDLSRVRIQSGELTRMVEHDGVVGITTNPTIFAKAIGSGAGYEFASEGSRAPGYRGRRSRALAYRVGCSQCL